MSNRPRDLFSLRRAVRHPLAHSFFSYAKRYCAAFNNGYGLDTNGASNLEELTQLVPGVLLRKTKDEALDLARKVRSWHPVPSPRRRSSNWRLVRLPGGESRAQRPHLDHVPWITK